MTQARVGLIAVTLLGIAQLASCQSALGARSAVRSFCMYCGVVESVQPRELRPGIGPGNALLAHTLSNGLAPLPRSKVVYDVIVRMEYGGRRMLTFDRPPPLSAGDKVEVTGTQLART
jgi:hypothetical protein